MCVDVLCMWSMCEVKWSAKIVKRNDSELREICKYKSDLIRKKYQVADIMLLKYVIRYYNMGIQNEWDVLNKNERH